MGSIRFVRRTIRSFRLHCATASRFAYGVSLVADPMPRPRYEHSPYGVRNTLYPVLTPHVIGAAHVYHDPSLQADSKPQAWPQQRLLQL